MHTIMHLLPSAAKQPNLELKTQPKQLLGSLPLVIALPGPTLLNLESNDINPANLQVGKNESKKLIGLTPMAFSFFAAEVIT